MPNLYIKENQNNAMKPFTLVERDHGPVETEYTNICDLSISHAILLNEYKIPWKDDTPDFVKVGRRVAVINAKQDLAKAEKRLKELEGN